MYVLVSAYRCEHIHVGLDTVADPGFVKGKADHGKPITGV